MKYFVAHNSGKGFITHAENEASYIAGYPGNVWATENDSWATRVGAVSKSLEDAQALVDADISGSFYEEGPDSGSQIVITLPTGSW